MRLLRTTHLHYPTTITHLNEPINNRTTNTNPIAELVGDASSRPLPEVNHEALIMGVDVARSGSNKSVLFFRQGRDARSIPPVIYPHLSPLIIIDVWLMRLLRTTHLRYPTTITHLNEPILPTHIR
jgi:hypothetical protein